MCFWRSLFAAVFAALSLAAALLQKWLGPSAAQVTVALGGLLDTHAAAAATARLSASGTLQNGSAVVAAMLAITVNILVKACAALVVGGRAFAQRLIPSHLAMIIALWVAWGLLR